MAYGFDIAIETTRGVVALWSSSVGHCFKVYYPLDVEIPDEMVMNTLGVEYAEPVYDDRIMKRQWAKYYSERQKIGRVWIDQTNYDCNAYHPGVVHGPSLTEIFCGYDKTNTITTYPFSFCSEEMPDAPIANQEEIQKYKRKFLNLLVEIAKFVGDIRTVTFHNGYVIYTPELLKKEGHHFIRWGDEYANYCYACNDNYEFVLKRSLSSWSTYINFCANNELVGDDLIVFMSQINPESLNMKPIFINVLKKAI